MPRGFGGRVKQRPDGGVRTGHVAGKDKGVGRGSRVAQVAGALPLQGGEPCRDCRGRAGIGRILPATEHTFRQRTGVGSDDGDRGRPSGGPQGMRKESGAVVHQPGLGHTSQPG